MKCGLPPTHPQRVLLSEIGKRSFAIEKASAQQCNRLLLQINGDKPFRLHATEVGTHVATKCVLRVEHDRPVRPSPKHHPMPERTIPFFVPLDRKQRTIWQSLP